MRAPTERQKRMAQMSLDGLDGHQIAKALGLAPNTPYGQLDRMKRVYGSLENAINYQSSFSRTWAAKAGNGKRVVSEMHRSILGLLSQGKNQTEVARELGVNRRAINYHCLRFVEYFGSIEAAIDDILGCQDETWDDDEPYGPVQRCKCGLTMPCNQCITTDYVFAVLDGHRDDNHAIAPHAHSEAAQLYGKEGVGQARG